MVFPWDKATDIYALDEGHKFSIAGQYQYPDKVKVGIFEDLKIDLGLVFKG